MNRGGFVLIAVLSMAVLIVMLLVVASTFAVSARQSVTAETQKIPAFYAANAGLERAVARMDAYLGASGTRYVNSRPEIVAAQVADVLHLSDLQSTSELPGGRFTVHGAANGGSVDLVSVGTSPSGATRTLSLMYDVYYVLRVLSNAAVNATGRVISADHVIEGDPTATPTGEPFTIGCRSTCPPTGTAPTTYTVTVRSGPLPDVGDVVTLASTPNSDLAFKVRHVDAVASTIDIAALDATNTALTDGQVLTQTTRGAALLTTGPGPLPTGTDCQAYACGTLDVPPDALFQETFGVSKQTFASGIGTHYDTDACSGAVRWIDLPDSPAPILTLGDCPAPRIVIVRAPPSADVPGGIPPHITVTTTPGSLFRGVLYVIGTHDLNTTATSDPPPPGPGSDITITATGGSFQGSVITENAITSATSAARTTTLTGTSTTPPGPATCPTPTGTTGTYAYCYDRSLLGGLLTNLNAALPDAAKPRVAVARYSWSENGN